MAASIDLAGSDLPMEAANMMRPTRCDRLDMTDSMWWPCAGPAAAGRRPAAAPVCGLVGRIKRNIAARRGGASRPPVPLLGGRRSEPLSPLSTVRLTLVRGGHFARENPLLLLP